MNQSGKSVPVTINELPIEARIKTRIKRENENQFASYTSNGLTTI